MALGRAVPCCIPHGARYTSTHLTLASRLCVCPTADFGVSAQLSNTMSKRHTMIGKPPSPPALPVADRVIKESGVGTFGRVLLCEDLREPGRRVAMKVVRAIKKCVAHKLGAASAVCSVCGPLTGLRRAVAALR